MYTCVSPCSFFFVDPITRVNVDDKSYKKQTYYKNQWILIYGALKPQMPTVNLPKSDWKYTTEVESD